MRVLLLGPPTVHLERWRELAAEAGCETVVVSYEHRHPGAVEHIPAVIAGRRAATVVNLLRAQARLRRVMRQIEPDLVHAHWLTGPGWIAALAGARPLVVSAWGSDALRWTPQSRLAQRLARVVAHRAQAVTYDAEAVGDALEAAGIPREHLVRVVFGVDARLFHPRRRDTELLERLGARPGIPAVLSPRGLDSVYRPATIIEAFARLAARRPATLLLRVGEGDAPRLPPLLALAERLGIADAVRPFESVEREELPRLLASVDAVVSVPESDGTSVLLLETLFTETPVVVSDLPANREWVTSESGAIVPVGDAQALADALERTLADPDGARVAVRALAEQARARGDSRRQLDALRDLYERVTQESPRRNARGRR